MGVVAPNGVAGSDLLDGSDRSGDVIPRLDAEREVEYDDEDLSDGRTTWPDFLRIKGVFDGLA